MAGGEGGGTEAGAGSNTASQSRPARGGRGGPGSGGDGSSRRGRGRGDGRDGGRERGGRGGERTDAAARIPQSRRDALLRGAVDGNAATTSGEAAAAAAAGDTDDDAEVCFICANPVIHHSIAPCNHITCHICALRMRALYRTKDCPHCRTPAPYVIFTDDPSKRFDEYTDSDISSTDDNIGIKYTNEDIVGDTVLLLRYNCPDESCDYAAFGWPDLHRHVRSVHHKKMCDLCTRNKKVFTHEHELFTDKGLETHMRHGDDRPGAIDQTGFKGHPLCGFCGERFYDDDKLYEHCRNRHERCFLCDRRDARQPHYYRNYDALEKHFREDHYLCFDRECLEKKFVVFESEIDLKAHQLSEHGNTLSKDVRRDVQVVSLADFDYRPAYQAERRGGAGGGGGSGGGRGRGGGRERDHGEQDHGQPGRAGRPSRGRDPNADAPVPISSAQNMRRDEIAYQRQLAIHSAQSISNRTFGSHLSTPTPATTSSRSGGSSSSAAAAGTTSIANNRRNAAPGESATSEHALADPMEALSVADLAHLPPQDRARLVRHGAVIERASNLLGSNPSKVNAFRANISAYRTGTLTATQLIEAFSNLFADTSDTALGSLVREVADLFEEPAKADALRKALNDRRAVHEDYPSLPTLGGMHGATTSTSGWAAAVSASPASSSTASAPAAAAQRQSSTRVLRLKHSTRSNSIVGNAAAVAAAVSNNGNNNSKSGTGPSGRSVPGATWTVPSSRPAVAPRMTGMAAAPPASSAFPALPSSTASGKKATSLAVSSSWGGAAGAASSAGGGRPGGAPSSSSSSLAARLGGNGPSSSQPSSRSSTPYRPQRPPGSGGGEDAFPALPAAPKPLTTIFGYGRGAVRRDLGGNRDTGFSWNGNGAGVSGNAHDPTGGASGGASGGEAAEDDEAGRGGKKKGKQGKKVLVQWG
ncbi:Zinc finger, RING/FYVE/PHD-type [Niveomyces insectorum RCEF 264]|uniref:RING-type E3 ubiquitin transferase n=1 Tax=Niveomyces insectorum RCEF 264 TaxID=1081102 RepID=A0A162K6B2_9HYPO|nr:Zinc finger, RING/FYVE/PHD-type [Niveomyces insectorum RCEF 264]